MSMKSALQASWLAAVGAIALGACADDAPSAYTLTFTGAAPRLLVAQDGDGAWQPVALTGADGTFAVTAGFHGWAAVCDPAPLVRVTYDAGDGGTPIRPCGSPPVQGVTLTGHVTPASAQVFVDVSGNPHAVEADGSYQASVAPGTHDLVFAEDGPRMLIRRAEAITADRVLDVDMAAGFDRTLATVTVTGAGADPVTVSSELHTLDGAGTYVPMSGAGDQIWLVPAAQRVATDRMVAMATMWTGDTTRVVQRLVTDATAPALTFAAPPTVTADRAGATWTTEPDWIYTVLRATVAPPVQVITTASRAWQAARGGGALPWLDPSALGAGAPTFTAGAALEWSVALETGDRAGELTFINRDGPLVW